MTERYLVFCTATVLLGAFNDSGQFCRFAAGIVAGFFGPNLANWTRTLLDA